jgi:hypothetical protein
MKKRGPDKRQVPDKSELEIENDKDQCSDQLDYGILCRDGYFAKGTFAAKKEP